MEASTGSPSTPACSTIRTSLASSSTPAIPKSSSRARAAVPIAAPLPGPLGPACPPLTAHFERISVALDPSSEAIYAGTTLGLFRSTDAGKTWTKVTDPVKSMAFDGKRILMASLHSGILISLNGGETVHPVNQGFSNRSLAMLTSAGNVIYATSLYDPNEGGLFKSQDFGGTWTHITGANNFLMLAAKTANPNIIYAAGNDTFFGSKDGGRSWLRAVAPPGKSTTALVATEDGSLWAGTTSGLYRKTDATSWVPIKIDGALRRVQLLDSSAHGRMAVVSDGRAFLSENTGRQWTACAAGPSGAEWYGISMSTESGVLAATSQRPPPPRPDRCATWTVIKSGLDASTVSSVLFHPTRPSEAYTSQDGKILRSLDAGEHWQPLDDRGRDGLYPARLLISPSRPDRLVALFPRRGIEISNIAVEGTGKSPEGEQVMALPSNWKNTEDPSRS